MFFKGRENDIIHEVIKEIDLLEKSIPDLCESPGCGKREKYVWTTDGKNKKYNAQLFVAM